MSDQIGYADAMRELDDIFMGFYGRGNGQSDAAQSPTLGAR